jgi:hypothetical protein
MAKQPQKKLNGNNTFGFEATQWAKADKLCGKAITQKRARCTG